MGVVSFLSEATYCLLVFVLFGHVEAGLVVLFGPLGVLDVLESAESRLLGVGELVVFEEACVAEGEQRLVLFYALRSHEVFVEAWTVSVVVEQLFEVVVRLGGLSAEAADQFPFGSMSQPLADHAVRVAFSVGVYRAR